MRDTFLRRLCEQDCMERRDILIIAIAGILAIVVGLTLASLLGLEVGLLQGSIVTRGIYPP